MRFAGVFGCPNASKARSSIVSMLAIDKTAPETLLRRCSGSADQASVHAAAALVNLCAEDAARQAVRAIIRVDVMVVRDHHDEQCDDGRADQDGAAALLLACHGLWVHASHRGSLECS